MNTYNLMLGVTLLIFPDTDHAEEVMVTQLSHDKINGLPPRYFGGVPLSDKHKGRIDKDLLGKFKYLHEYEIFTRNLK